MSEELPELLKRFVIEKKEYYILLDVVWKEQPEGRDLEEIIRRLKASEEKKYGEKEIRVISRALLSFLNFNISPMEKITAQEILDDINLSKNVELVLRLDN